MTSVTTPATATPPLTGQDGIPAGRRHDLLRLATAGSVDDGKSTLVGRLLYDTKSVLADQLVANFIPALPGWLATKDLLNREYL